MLKGCNRCGWIQRNHRLALMDSRCPRCGHLTSALRYEAVYGPPQARRREDRATPVIRAEDDAPRC